MPPQKQPDPVDVLAFGPHPDDVEMCAGGWMLKLRDQGRRVAVVDFTRGEAASRGTPAGREEEVAAASAIMGLAGRENLALPDTGLEVTPAMASEVAGAIRKWRPRLVLGPCPEDLHPDHVAAAQLVKNAYYLATIGKAKAGGWPPHRPDGLVHYYGHLEPTPSFVADVSDVWERKLELMRCFTSQMGLDGAKGPRTNLTSPDFLDRFTARFAYWGSRIGARWGEPFLTHRLIALDDPVEAFRKRGWQVL
jgi:bacillithiol biosynthesis deacetylase BshB1